MDRGAWWAAVNEVAKSRTRLNWFTFTFHFPALEKEMATHSSVLAWRIPGTAEPGGLPSMGLHGVGRDWSDLAAAALASKVCICFLVSQVSVFRSCFLVLANQEGIKCYDIWFSFLFSSLLLHKNILFIEYQGFSFCEKHCIWPLAIFLCGYFAPFWKLTFRR